MRLETEIARVSSWWRRIVPRIAFGAVLWMILGTLLLMQARVSSELVGLNVFVSFVASVLSMIATFAQRRGAVLGVRRRGERGFIDVGEQLAIGLGEQRFTVDRSAVAGGFREEIGLHDQVVLELRDEQVFSIRVRSAEEGEALLDACGVGAAQRTVTMRVGAVRHWSGRALLASLCILSVLVAVPSGIGVLATIDSLVRPGHLAMLEFSFAFLLLSTLGFFLTWSALRVQLVSIGRDGVLVRSGALSKKFFAFSDLHVARWGPRIDLRSATGYVRIKAASDTEASTIVKRIEAARARTEEHNVARTAILARNGRSLAEWQQALRALFASPVGYRGPVDPSELVTLIEDSTGDKEERVGAALALSSLPTTAPERTRLRVAIESTAEPTMRLALENASEGEVGSELERLLR